ncbi:MAG: 3-phosphoshikimate 1-carboxyvinyltransferase [Chitinophagaceae bacterium]
MKVTIHPSPIKGIVQAPASKSSMQRALAAAFLTKETCSLFNPGHSNDDKAATGIIRSLGAKVEMPDNNLVVVEKGDGEENDNIHCGESGLSIRMFVPIAALSNRSITVNGEGSLLNRPMEFFDEVLPQLGVTVKSNNGKLPLVVKGPLQPKNIEIDASLSSQFLTGLLMAFAAAGANDVSIKVKNLKSRPYIDLTLDVMKEFGLKVPQNKNYEEFYFRETPSAQLANKPINYFVEGDWSGGAFLLVAGAIAGPVTVRGLDLTSAQADKAIVDALMAANAGIAIEAKGIKVRPSAMNGFDFDATDCPDLFPPLVALAAYCKGETKIKGVSRLKHKESNRAVTLQEEFGKMGVKIDVKDDSMIIYGGNGVKGTNVHSHHDHRIAMACSVAALKAESETIIEEAGAVKKSYPDFFSDLKSLGASVSLPYQQFNL